MVGGRDDQVAVRQHVLIALVFLGLLKDLFIHVLFDQTTACFTRSPLDVALLECTWDHADFFHQLTCHGIDDQTFFSTSDFGDSTKFRGQCLQHLQVRDSDIVCRDVLETETGICHHVVCERHNCG